MKFNVSPMTCGSCVSHITKLVQGAEPSAVVRVDLALGTVDIDAAMSPDQAQGLLAGAGYEAVPVAAEEAVAAVLRRRLCNS